MMASDKVDRKRLPRPEHRISQAAAGSYTAPTTAAEEALAEQLGAVLGLDKVSTDAHFFNDLGADSLLMARFCARIRKETALPPAAMQDIYENPTVRQLAACLEARHSESVHSAAVPETGAVPPAPMPPVSSFQYFLCGAIQLLVFLGYTMYAAWLLVFGFEWTSGGTTLLDMWLRSIGFGAAMFVILSVTPILVKWVLVGRWKPGTIRIWSLAYLRFWAVKTLTRANPLALFAGSPLYVLYLRLLGAKIGKGVVIFSRKVPACPDLLTVGDNTVIHKNSSFLCYRAHSGIIEMGPVTLGRNVLVSEKTTFDIGRRWATTPSSDMLHRCRRRRPYPTGRSGTVPPPRVPAPITCGSRPSTAAPAGGSSSACSSCSTAWSWLFRRPFSGWPRSCRPTWTPATCSWAPSRSLLTCWP